MNVEKMRKTLERSAEVRERDERRRWLANMTPEHRARHERDAARTFPSLICPECLHKSLEPIRRMSERAAARKAP